MKWTASRTATAVNPQTVASPAQVRAILAEVTRLRPVGYQNCAMALTCNATARNSPGLQAAEERRGVH